VAVASGISSAQQMESRIDTYLANYGKPPREAVRALLDPSDDNIRALLAQQEKTLSLAGYVAARMTAFKQDSTALSEGIGPRDGPSFGRMRISLHQSARDTSTRTTLRALAELVRSVPALQAGVALAGPLDSAQLSDAVGRIDPALSVTPAPKEPVDTLRMPFLRIEDLQNGTAYDFDAHDWNVDQIREAVIAVRRNGTAANAVPAPANLPGASQ